MNETVLAALKHYNINPKQVVTSAVYEDHVAVVIDRGIKGSPKYLLPLAPVKTSGRSKVTATPAAATKAQESRLVLDGITGSGKSGKIMLRDVDKALAAQAEANLAGRKKPANDEEW